MLTQSGTLYVVATPIGNLDDITIRAVSILKYVDLIAAEDTRHSRILLSHLGIKTPLKSYHEHNEAESTAFLIERLQQGENIALISDAGTPLVSDPGYKLICAAHEYNIHIVPVPGPSALISALSVAGLPTDRFIFEGFAPEKQAARIKRLTSLVEEQKTVIFYETPHRIVEFLKDAVDIFGQDRLAVIAREMTKRFEVVRKEPLGKLLDWIEEDTRQQRGEIVVLIQGSKTLTRQTGLGDQMLGVLLKHSISVKQAASIVAEITGDRKNELYNRALQLKHENKCRK